ncbi:tRNA (adenine(22)-N(1))-methyltransferase [Allohahella marinimesophila]|uniref:tRNA (Adenine(22)-N(1))-methyltransferase TrmK n=1 Tax=Allohahella marinimesophila TaxID=1054972 RepID=A0ABP7NW15_9GAMM
MRFGKRLRQIEAMVAPGYDHIWDCCCDHGLLGAALLSGAVAPHIHFVDIVPELVEALDYKLQRFDTQPISAWTTHCVDVRALPLQQYPGRHLIVIAGVGGALTGQFIEAIHQRIPQTQMDFLLCPVRQQFSLREQLIRLAFSLKDEVLIEDRQRFYEVLLVSSDPDEGEPIHKVGKAIWQADTAEKRQAIEAYRQQTLRHYQRMQSGSNMEIHDILEAYGAVPKA